MAKQEKRRRVSLGVLFWIAIILLILVVFLFNRRNIEQVMENTGLVEIINQRIGIEEGQELPPEGDGQLPDEPNGESPNGSTEQTTNTSTDETTEENSGTTSDQQLQNTSPEERDESTGTPENESIPEDQNVGSNSGSENNNTEAEDATPEDSKVRSYTIHLAYLEEDGAVSVRPVEKEITFTSSPLTQTINALLTERDLPDSYQNLIPEGSELNRIWIENGTAFLDFSDNFRFNPLGMSGQQLQLEQVVRTATQFSTVDAVQILINGEKLEFLGGDGTYIGNALRADDF